MKTKPVVLVVMDGVGLSDNLEGNAVAQAYLPHLEALKEKSLYTTLKAHGTAVGLPSDDDMGNSEVGHNALGAGQIYAQGAKLVNQSIASGEIFQSETWLDMINYLDDQHTLHLIGLLSDGNVHSHINHVKALIENAKKAGIKRVALHALSDGRDVDSRSALVYIEDIEKTMIQLNDENFDSFVASGGGRMLVTMDRYEAEWNMVERGWQTHVLGSGRMFKTATEAITTYRDEISNLSDQYIPAWVIEKDDQAIAPIVDGDGVIFFNFRGDRAIEISRAFEEGDSFDKFDRIRKPEVYYVGMLQYDGDLNIPKKYLVTPPRISHTLTERLVAENLSQYAISETQKFGHVTYFWNGNRTEPFDKNLETWEEITSDLVPFDQRPWMKAAEITDNMIAAINSDKYQFLRLNYPNGDMVGHTGDFQAAKISVEAVDLMIGRLLPVIEKHDYTLILLADHGNADEMYQKRKSSDAPFVPKTSHTLNPVPLYIYNGPKGFKIKEGHFGLANIASTVTDLLGVDQDPIWEESIITKE